MPQIRSRISPRENNIPEGNNNQIKNTENRLEIAIDKVFIYVEKEAEFPGGTEAWQRFLQRNLKPTIPVDKGAPSGSYTVTVQFIVGFQGNISNVRALTKHGYGMEEEAIRLIKTGPKWVPAIQNGHNVNSIKNQNVTFNISLE